MVAKWESAFAEEDFLDCEARMEATMSQMAEIAEMVWCQWSDGPESRGSVSSPEKRILWGPLRSFHRVWAGAWWGLSRLEAFGFLTVPLHLLP